MRAGIRAKYNLFTTIREDGAILGPWNAWLHEPEPGSAIWGVTKAMTKFAKLPDRVRQIVILVVGTRFGAAYEIYAHSAVAKSTGIAAPLISTIVAGCRPTDMSDEEGAAYDVAFALCHGGVLPEPTYRYALSRFGQSGVNELIYLVGHYCFVSVTLNGFDIAVPTENGQCK
jgi:hypothetical protein